MATGISGYNPNFDNFGQPRPQAASVGTPIPPTNGVPASTPNPAKPAAPSQYDLLMKQYNDLLAAPSGSANLTAQYNQLYNAPPITSQPISAAPVAAKTTPYTQDPNVTSSISNLADLSQTGGYSASGIADLRARAVSPVRSVYASAQRNIDRAKVLQGGYSPNYTAATAKLTRGQSDAASSALTDANASIAQNVASNKLQIAPQYASASAQQNAARTATEQNNDQTVNDTNKFNSSNATDAQKFNSSSSTQSQQFDATNKQNILQSLSALYKSGVGDKLAILDAMKQLYGQQGSLGLQNKGLDNLASATLINAYRN